MRSARGHLLLELLVATAIFATLAALAWGGLDAVVAARAAVDREAARLAAVQRTMSRIERDLGEIAPRPVRGDGGALRPALIGSVARLELSHAAFLSAGMARSAALARSAWVLDGDRLLRRSDGLLDRVPSVSGAPLVMLDGVEAFALRYLDRSGAWRREWPAPTGADGDLVALPRAVELSLRLRDLGEITRVFELPEGVPR